MNLSISLIFWAVFLYLALPLATIWISNRGTRNLRLQFSAVTLLTSWVGVAIFFFVSRRPIAAR